MPTQAIDPDFLAAVQSVYRGIKATGTPPGDPDIANVSIRAMRDLYWKSPHETPLDVLVDEETLIPDGDWGSNAQAAFAMISHIAEHGEFPSEDDDTQVEDQPVQEGEGCSGGT